MLNNMKLRRSSSTLKSLQPIELPERSPLMSQSPTPSPLTEPQLPIKLSDLKRMEQIGSATVYKVVHKPTEQLYALIEIDPRSTPRGGVGEAPDDPREPNLRDVDNPNVVKCHNIFDADESKVLLEFMDGGSLEGKHIPNEEALSELARQILTWLTYLHKRRVVHRDIKPSNLLVNAGNQVKLADVGVDRIVSVATIAYMSPERISTDDNQGIYDAYAGDVWSFGVSILELYMGRFPFNLGDWANLMKAICMSQPPEAPATASRELRHFISCCLQREPSKRMSAAQLLQHPFISGSETAAGSTLPTLNF